MFGSGSYSILYIKSGTEYYPVGCLTDNSFNESSEMMSTTTRDNTDGWTTSKPTSQSFDIPFSGVVTIEDDTSLITYLDIRTLKRDRTLIEWKIESGIDENIDYGYGYISSISKTDTVNEFMTFTGTITGYEKPLELIGNMYIDSDYIDDYYL